MFHCRLKVSWLYPYIKCKNNWVTLLISFSWIRAYFSLKANTPTQLRLHNHFIAKKTNKHMNKDLMISMFLESQSTMERSLQRQERHNTEISVVFCVHMFNAAVGVKFTRKQTCKNKRSSSIFKSCSSSAFLLWSSTISSSSCSSSLFVCHSSFGLCPLRSTVSLIFSASLTLSWTSCWSFILLRFTITCGETLH